MKESRDMNNETQCVENLWSAVVESVPGTTVVNRRKLVGEKATALFTFCPLYSPGSLQSSELLGQTASIAESRVAGKWGALQKVVATIFTQLQKENTELEVSAVFANRGVLLGSEPSDEDDTKLSYHEELYREAVVKFCDEKGIAVTFQTYDELEVPLPRFVNPSDAIPEHEISADGQKTNLSEEGKIITALNAILAERDVPTRLRQAKDTRGKIRLLVNAFGAETAYALIAGYLMFDHQIPELAGSGGVYLMTERYKALFRIANLTPGVREMTRMEIPA